MRRPYEIRTLEDPSRARRMRLAKLREAVRAGLYWVPAEIVAKSILQHLGFGKSRELSHQKR